MIDCIFCEIVAGNAEASVVYQDESMVAFLDIRPVNPGHLLVVPRRHAAGLADLPEHTGCQIFRIAHKLAIALRESGLPCEGINFFLADGEAAGQEVFHVHLHVLPRHSGDGFGLVFGPCYRIATHWIWRFNMATPAAKLDLRKQFKHLYQPGVKKVEVVDVPAFQFAMVDGQIEAGQSPGTSPAYQAALEALYGISYTLKFNSKLREENPLDYTVMPLEGLWWVEGGEFDISRPDNWRWIAMILQPDHITPEMFDQGLAQLRKKKASPALDLLRFETFHEGLSLQIMHVGPYAEEPATIEKMHAFAHENGYRLRGKHHEIYLGDPRRTDPAKLKTVLRQPVERT